MTLHKFQQNYMYIKNCIYNQKIKGQGRIQNRQVIFAFPPTSPTYRKSEPKPSNRPQPVAIQLPLPNILIKHVSLQSNASVSVHLHASEAWVFCDVFMFFPPASFFLG